MDAWGGDGVPVSVVDDLDTSTEHVGPAAASGHPVEPDTGDTIVTAGRHRGLGQPAEPVDGLEHRCQAGLAVVVVDVEPEHGLWES